MASVGQATVELSLALDRLKADTAAAADLIRSQVKDVEVNVNVKINTDTVAEQAKQAGLTVQEAIDQGIAKIDSNGRLRDLSGRFIKIGEDGRIAGEEIGKAFEAAGESSSSIAKLAEALDTSYAKANQFAQSLGLTSEQASQAVRQIQQLNSVEATLDEQFAALSNELGLTKEQFAALSVATKEAGESGKGFNAFLQGIAQGIGQQAIGLLVQSLHQAGDALKGLVGDALSSAEQLNSASAALSTLGVNGGEVTKSLQQLSKELGYQVTTTELVKVGYDVFSAKTESLTKGLTDQAAATDILKASVIGAKAGFSDTGTVADALTTILNSYGLSAAHASDIVDKLVVTQNLGKITVNQYAQQIGRIAPIAAQAGVSLDELNGFISVATVKGLSAESSVSGLRQALTAVLQPSNEAKEAAKNLKIEFDATALKTKGLSGILAELHDRGEDTQENLFALFRSVEAVAAIAPSTGEGLKTLKDSIEASGKAAGTSQEAYEKVSGTLENRVASASNQAKEALTTLGESLLPIKASLTELFSGVLSEAADKSQAFNILSEAAERFSNALKDDPEIAKNLGDALAKISDALAELTAQGLDTLIAKLKDPSFGKFVDELTRGFEGISAAIEIVLKAADALGGVVQPINTQTLTGVNDIGFALSKLNDLFNLIIQTVEDLGAKFAKLPIVSQLLQAADAAGKLLDKLNQLPGATPGTAKDSGLSGALDKFKPGSPETSESTAPAAAPKPDTKDELDKLKSDLADRNAAIEQSYKQSQTTIANSVAAGNETEKQSRTANLAAEKSYLNERIASNREALGKLQQLEQSTSDPKEKAKIQQEIRQTESQIAGDRLSIAQKGAQARVQADKDAEQEQKKAAREALQEFESINKQAEASITQSQSNRVTKIKEAQLQGIITEQEASAQIAQVAIDTTNKQIAQKQKEIAEIRKLRSNGSLDAQQAADKEASINTELSNLKQQLIDKEIEAQKRAKEAALKEVEDSNRRAEAAITESQANRIAAIKQAQLEGVLSEKDAQNQIIQVEADGANQTIAQKQAELAKVRQLRAQGVLSAQEAADKETALVTEIAQANQARIDKEISAQKALREQVLETLQLEQTNPLQAQEGQLEAIAASLQTQLNLAQAGADLEAKKGQLAEEQLKTQIKIAEASGNQQAVAQLNVQLQQLSAQNEEKQYQAKLRTLEIQQKLKQTELQQEAVKARIAQIEAEINVQKAIAEGKTQQEIQQLQIIAGLRQQQLDQAQQSIQAQQQLFDIQKQSLDADRQIGLERQKQNAIGGAGGSKGGSVGGSSDYGPGVASSQGGISSFGLGSSFGMGPDQYARSSPKGGGVSYNLQSTTDSSKSSSDSTSSSTAATGGQGNPVVDAVGRSGDKITSKLDEVIKAISPGSSGAGTGDSDSDSGSASGTSIDDRVKQFQKNIKDFRDQLQAAQSTPAINLPGGASTAASVATGSQALIDAVSKGNDKLAAKLDAVIAAINKTGSRPSVTVNGGGSTDDLLKWYNNMAIDHNRACG